MKFHGTNTEKQKEVRLINEQKQMIECRHVCDSFKIKLTIIFIDVYFCSKMYSHKVGMRYTYKKSATVVITTNNVYVSLK